MISYYPAQAIARGEFGPLALAAPVAGLALLGAGALCWRAGLRRYGSAGS